MLTVASAARPKQPEPEQPDDVPTATREPDVVPPRVTGFSWPALTLGFRRRCPSCGQGRLFQGYLRVVARCQVCSAELGLYRADDAPAYFTIAIVGHIAVFALLMIENTMTLPMWELSAILVAATLAATLVLLPRIKGTLIGLHWSLGLKTAHAPCVDP